MPDGHQEHEDHGSGEGQEVGSEREAVEPSGPASSTSAIAYTAVDAIPTSNAGGVRHEGGSGEERHEEETDTGGDVLAGDLEASTRRGVCP